MVDESFKSNALRQLKTSKASGLDGISPHLLKDAAEVISKPLTQIINASLSQGTVPHEWKHARVTPLFKKGVSTDMDNYLSCPWRPNYWSGLFTISCAVSVMNTSYLVLFNVDLDQITPLNLLPLPSLISFDVVWIKVYLLALCLSTCAKRLILSITIY